MRDAKDINSIKDCIVFSVCDLVKDNALVLPKSSLFVKYLQTKKHHTNARILFPSAFYIIVCLLLNEEEKVAKKKTKLKKYLIWCKNMGSWKIMWIRESISQRILLSRYFFPAHKHTLKNTEQIIMILYQLKCKPLSWLFPYITSPLLQAT